MTATLEDALRQLRAEGAAARPTPYSNPRRDYNAEIAERRLLLEEDSADEA